IIMIETEDAFEMMRQIARKEAIFVGMSSGAAMLAAKIVAEKVKSGTIVTIFPDRGEKYLSTGVFGTKC
ncbi:MAG: pyridoxal-phosphate dependent enzyme, partial [Deltaproteobacteria bacterium]|nr:pyridoxal-phosphate dependent enzyme [Deltaproteobacteria bacterium]